jgi:hypothetical protein
MKKIGLLLLVLGLSVLLGGCTLPLVGTKKKAALQVNSTPKATVFINSEHVGQTPYVDENLKEGEVVVKLVPETNGTTLGTWEGRVKLVSGILTVVTRTLGATEEESAGYVLTLEPISDNTKSGLTVVSTPDRAIITLNGEPKGFAPLSLDSIDEGDQEVLISLPGYQEQRVKAKAVKGYKLMINVQLARSVEKEEDKEATPSAQPTTKDANDTTGTPTPTKKAEKTASASAKLARPYVTIKSPDIGWVRVRSEPSTTAEELTKVYDGESFKLLDTNPAGWYQIEYLTGKKGWISGKYAEKYQ